MERKGALFTSNSDNWETPQHILNYLNKVYAGWFDPCPYEENISEVVDGLKIEWGDRNYINPPFSSIASWVGKGIEEHKLGKEVLFLIPARTDTKYFEKLYEYGANFVFIVGRLKYSDKNSAPFPSVFVYLTGRENKMFYEKRDDLV